MRRLVLVKHSMPEIDPDKAGIRMETRRSRSWTC